jgi:16S rRNA (guanine527-N7)-methyltransferase
MPPDAASSRLRQLAEQYGLGDRAHDQLATLLTALAGDEHAPTAVRDPDRSIDVHVADSLVALELEAVRRSRVIADLGAGAGFPGLVLAVALPDSEVRLVESQARKCAFIERAIAEARLENARVICARAEEWHGGMGEHDLLVVRALAPQPVVLEYAAPLLRLGGSLVDWRGRRVRTQEDAASRAAQELGLRRVEIRRVEPFEQVIDHHLHVFVKAEETPERFPRRAGIARKRPLGA